MRYVFLCSCLFLGSGCYRFDVPCVTECHPACPYVETCEIELSPILDYE